jgi:acetyltransferase-like isoleucine patch superfamily enzyme
MVVPYILKRGKSMMDRQKSIAGSEKDIQELFFLLEKLKGHFDITFSQELKRSLPFADLLFDRWERAKKLGFGEGTSVYATCHLFGDVKIGSNTWVGPFTILDGSGGLTIGNNCSISAGVQIYTHDSVKWATSGGKEAYEHASSSIGNNCYIGPQSVIAMGVHLGDGCVVGANSFVRNSFPAGSRVAGSPAKLI